ncbi:MAG: ABC transporter ATP-binding protein [Bdellovibrionaceae bacterium]|nr:ABC transporter ATP-binding protein [Pseudobdellovibrionaceae bacterium]
MSNILDVRNISLSFGGLKALQNVSFSVEKGQIFGIIGPNGAGKTTLFNIITGLYKPQGGSVFFMGQEISGKKPHEISRMGLTRTFQNIRLFKNLSVTENVLLGLSGNLQYGWWDMMFQTHAFCKEEEEGRQYATKLLEMFELRQWKDALSGDLSYGSQRRVEMVRALMSRPQLICLDEPAAGMNHRETDQLRETIQQVSQFFNVTILLIEHDMSLVMKVCDEIIVLDHGELIAQGEPSAIQKNQAVVEAYLGVDFHGI